MSQAATGEAIPVATAHYTSQQKTSLVQFYTVYKLQRMAAPTTRLYLLCFAYYRFRQINDNLVEAFIYLVDQFVPRARHQ